MNLLKYQVRALQLWIVLLLLGMSQISFSESITFEEKVAQLIMVGFRGLYLEDNTALKSFIHKYSLGGVVLYDVDVAQKSQERNIHHKTQVAELTQALQSVSKIPLWIAIDQEGGQVARLKPKHGYSESLSAFALGQKNDFNLTESETMKVVQSLNESGINMNLAPVLDLRLNENNPIIAGKERSFSADPKKVVDQAKIIYQVHNQYSIANVYKHFPGHGSSVQDTHLDFTDVSDVWQKIELDPYQSLIQQGLCDFIMTAHIYNRNLDPQYPATLSKPILTGILREQLGFDGVILSDDMQMKAISDYYGLKESIALALNAGVDLLIFANNVSYQDHIYEKAHQLILDLVQEKKITKKQIDDSFHRIIKFKKKYLKFDDSV